MRCPRCRYEVKEGKVQCPACYAACGPSTSPSALGSVASPTRNPTTGPDTSVSEPFQTFLIWVVIMVGGMMMAAAVGRGALRSLLDDRDGVSLAMDAVTSIVLGLVLLATTAVLTTEHVRMDSRALGGHVIAWALAAATALPLIVWLASDANALAHAHLQDGRARGGATAGTAPFWVAFWGGIAIGGVLLVDRHGYRRARIGFTWTAGWIGLLSVGFGLWLNWNAGWLATAARNRPRQRSVPGLEILVIIVVLLAMAVLLRKRP